MNRMPNLVQTVQVESTQSRVCHISTGEGCRGRPSMFTPHPSGWFHEAGGVNWPVTFHHGVNKIYLAAVKYMWLGCYCNTSFAQTEFTDTVHYS